MGNDIELTDQNIWICGKCGNRNEIYLINCKKCGKEYNQNNDNNDNEEVSEENNIVEENDIYNSGESVIKRILFISVIVIIVLIVGLIVKNKQKMQELQNNNNKLKQELKNVNNELSREKELKDTGNDNSINNSDILNDDLIYQNNESDVTVYVAGYYWDRDSSTDVACYWKDGEKIDLTDARYADARAYAIAIAPNGAVYIAGTYRNTDTGNSKTIACYWKDGIKTDLSDDSGSSRASAIVITSDGTVYAAGYYHWGKWSNDTRACYWKDGIRTDLELWISQKSSADAIESRANAIAIAPNGDVYITGYYRLYGSNVNVGCYWKDDVKIDLNGDVKGIAIASNGSTYILGNGYYWKDGERTNFYTVPVRTWANSIIIASDGSIHIAGTNSLWGESGFYWKDGAEICLYSFYPSSIAISSNDSIYIAGNYYLDKNYDADGHMDRTSTPCYWKDDVKTDLFFDEDSYAAAEAIVVVTKAENNKTEDDDN
jgi:hypothetical protein